MSGLPDYSFGRRTPYHRALLDGSSRRIYDDMLSAMKRGETSLRIDAFNGDIGLLRDILAGVLDDSPLLFWASGSIKTLSSGSSVTVSISVNELYDDQEAYMEELRERCSAICRAVSGSFDDEYGISLALHDYLVDSVEYVDEGARSHCALGPILDGKGVCEGIADAYNLLMNAFGVRCTKIDGHTFEDADTGHSWNISIIDGHAYHTDVTFDLGGMHRFLNLNDNLMALTHCFKRSVQCDSLDANYHHRNGTLFDTVAESDSYIRRNIVKGRREIEFMILEESSIDHCFETVRKAYSGRVSVHMSGDRHGFQLRTRIGLFERIVNSSTKWMQ